MKARQGVGLLELLISIALLGVVVIGLGVGLRSSLSAHQAVTDREALLAEATFALGRMGQYLQDSVAVIQPASTNPVEILQLSECTLDEYDNATHARQPDGDGLLDADNDSDRLVNEGDATDPADVVTFALDKADPANWQLTEQRPDYGTAALDDVTAPISLCGHVVRFTARQIAWGLVELRLVLNSGHGDLVLVTRVPCKQ